MPAFLPEVTSPDRRVGARREGTERDTASKKNYAGCRPLRHACCNLRAPNAASADPADRCQPCCSKQHVYATHGSPAELVGRA